MAKRLVHWTMKSTDDIFKDTNEGDIGINTYISSPVTYKNDTGVYNMETMSLKIKY